MYTPSDHFEVLARFAEALTKLQESERKILLNYFQMLVNPPTVIKPHAVDILV